MNKDLAASLRARLLNVAKAQCVDFNQVLVRFALERILYRLSQSAHADHFLLKGALLFTLWYDLPHRTTRDYLLNQFRYFHEAHRAEADCQALLEILRQPLPKSRRTGLSFLVTASQSTSLRIWATGSPFDNKDKLKALGYRFDGASKVWNLSSTPDRLEVDLQMLKQAGYNGWPAKILIETQDAKSRFSSRPGTPQQREILVSMKARGLLFNANSTRVAALAEYEVGDIVSGHVIDADDKSLVVELETTGVIALLFRKHLYMGEGEETHPLMQGEPHEFVIRKLVPLEHAVELSRRLLSCLGRAAFIAGARIGDRYDGKVAWLEKFGVMIEILPGVCALLHYMHMGSTPEAGLQKFSTLQVGDWLPVRIAEIDPIRERILLSFID